MFIDRVCPALVAEKSTLRDRLIAEATASGLTNEFTECLINTVPEPLISTGAFLDRLSGLWRYEFGVPYNIANNLYWGTHMWVPVAHLFVALRCAYVHLPQAKRIAYLARLSNAEKHHATLVEMIPAQNIAPATSLEFEVAGLGAGNYTVDWVARHHDGRTVLLDVKRRTTDFIAQAEGMAADPSAQKPVHDPALLFRDIEKNLHPLIPSCNFKELGYLLT